MTILLGIIASPFVISALTGWVKSWTPFASLSDGARTAGVRALAAAISFVYVVVGMWITGNVDTNIIQTGLEGLALAFVPFLSSLGLFHAFFQKQA